MPRALILRCLLALALVLQGLPAWAMDGHAHADAAASAQQDVADGALPACHDAPAPAPSPAPDCCDDGGADCGCDCVHAASLVVAMRSPPGASPPADEPPARSVPGTGSSAPLPSLRPPIA